MPIISNKLSARYEENQQHNLHEIGGINKITVLEVFEPMLIPFTTYLYLYLGKGAIAPL